MGTAHTITNEDVDMLSETKTPKVTLFLCNRQLDLIVNTGASVNIISNATYERIPEVPELHGPYQRFMYTSPRQSSHWLRNLRQPFNSRT